MLLITQAVKKRPHATTGSGRTESPSTSLFTTRSRSTTFKFVFNSDNHDGVSFLIRLILVVDKFVD